MLSGSGSGGGEGASVQRGRPKPQCTLTRWLVLANCWANSDALFMMASL